MSSDSRRIRASIPWSFLAVGATRLGSLAVLLVLARLLAPADFGIVALGASFVMALGFFAELGLSSGLVLAAPDRAREETTLMLMVLGGTAMAVVGAALSPLAQAVFDIHRLAPVMAVMSASLALTPVAWFYDALLQRELEFRPRFLGQAAQVLTYGAVAIGLAAAGAGVWSIVAGQLVSVAVQAATFARLAPYRVRPRLRTGRAREVVGDSWGFAAQGALLFLRQNLDYYAVGALAGARQLGFYSVAYRLGEVPTTAVAEPTARVTFPAFAQRRARQEDAGILTAYLTSLRMVTLVAFPLGILLSVSAEPLTLTLLGDRWRGMIGPLAVLGLWGVVRVVEAMAGWLLNSYGETRLMATLSLTILVVQAPALFLAAAYGDITTVAWVMLAERTLTVLALIACARARAGVSLRDHARALLPAVSGAALGWAGGFLALQLAPEGDSVLALAAVLSAAALAYLLGVHVADRGALGTAARDLRRLIPDRSA